MADTATASPFPPRDLPTLRVDSVAEAYAYLAAWPPASGSWQRTGQMLVPGGDGPEDHLTVRAPDGTSAVLRFAIGSFYGDPEAARTIPGDRVTAAMRAGHELAKAEGPLHPGTLPQYPVPSADYPGTVAIPLPILAVDAGQRGLYAPPRIAVVRWPSGEGVGVGDAPGFDPARWPPPRLGDWPPATLGGWEPARLSGAIERFTAVWVRLLDAWFGDRADAYPHLADERREARLLLALLLPAPLLDLYAELGPRFWSWLGGAQAM
jgi:hypothetical protein